MYTQYISPSAAISHMRTRTHNINKCSLSLQVYRKQEAVWSAADQEEESVAHAEKDSFYLPVDFQFW